MAEYPTVNRTVVSSTLTTGAESGRRHLGGCERHKNGNRDKTTARHNLFDSSILHSTLVLVTRRKPSAVSSTNLPDTGNTLASAGMALGYFGGRKKFAPKPPV